MCVRRVGYVATGAYEYVNACVSLHDYIRDRVYGMVRDNGWCVNVCRLVG